MRRRDLRNREIKEYLTSGRTAQYRSTGNRMWRVKIGDGIMLAPVIDPEMLHEQDVVFCEVHPDSVAVPTRARFYCHIILRIDQWRDYEF